MKDPVLDNQPEHIGGSSFEWPRIEPAAPEDPAELNICLGCE